MVPTAQSKPGMPAANVDTLDDICTGVVESVFDTSKTLDILFKRVSIKQTGDNMGKILGDLATAGITTPVTLVVRFDGEGKSARLCLIEFVHTALA
jgi:polyisoprenoid-binding protein YceI